MGVLALVEELALWGDVEDEDAGEFVVAFLVDGDAGDSGVAGAELAFETVSVWVEGHEGGELFGGEVIDIEIPVAANVE